MAIPFLNNINLSDNQLLNAKLQVTSTAPTAAAGQIYFNSTDNVARYHNGTAWVDIPRKISVGGTALAYSQAIDLVAGTNVGIAESSGTITISSTDQFQGTVTSVSASTAGDALDVTVTNGTTTPNLAFTWGGDATKYVNGLGNLVTFPTIPGTYSFNVSDGSNSEAVASGDTVTWSGTGTTTVTYAAGSNTFTVNSADQYTGTVESVGLSMPAAFAVANSPVTTSGTLAVTGAGATTEYIDGTGALQTFPTTDNYSYWVLSDGTTTTNITSTGVATFQGTANEVEVDEASGIVTIGLPDNVTIGGNLTVTTALDMTAGKINNLATGTASTDAVNLGQVQGLIAGTGQFQGGYDATNDPGSPVISGSSNIALNTGDFYVVTVDGDITFSDQTISVEVGDLIFANTDITVNSNPASTVYTFVIQDQNIAGEGANDAATEKGVAGFNSAHFSVTANGFVSADIYSGGSALGIVPSGGVATTFLRGDGTWVTPTNTAPNDATITLTAGTNLTGGGDFTTDQSANEIITFNLATADASNIGASNVAAGTGISVAYSSGTATVTNTETNSDNTFVGQVGGTATPSPIVHNLGTKDVIVQLYDKVTFETVYADVERNDDDEVTITFAATPTNTIRVLVQKIG